MDLRAQIAEVIRGDERYPARAELSSAESIANAVMVPVSAHVGTMAATIEQQRQEIVRLRHELAVARGETIGVVPSWAEYAEQERAREAEAARHRPKPHLTLKEARDMAALERARGATPDAR
jgi:hypothetical protein